VASQWRARRTIQASYCRWLASDPGGEAPTAEQLARAAPLVMGAVSLHWDVGVYHFRVTSIQTEILTWLRFPYGFESRYA
jgi:hypothetical protein